MAASTRLTQVTVFLDVQEDQAEPKMFANRRQLAGIAFCVLLAGCVALPPPATPLQIQSVQTREYEQGKQVVFAGVMSVFQDLGYIVNSADLATGFITTEGLATGETGILEWLLNTSQVTQTRATAFIEEVNDKTRVRLNFVETWRESRDQGQSTRRDRPILDAEVYENAFDRIENAIFVRSG